MNPLTLDIYLTVNGFKPAPIIPETTSRKHLASFAMKTTLHPALIPQEVAGSSRRDPQIPATAPTERPAIAGESPPIHAQSGRAMDRPVTPEVAGSSPVAPVKN